MEFSKLTFAVLSICFFEFEAQNIEGQFHYERRGGLLSGLGSLGGAIRVPSLSSGLKTTAESVHNILSATKNTVEKFIQPVSVEINAQIGHSNENQNTQIQYNPDNSNLNNGNSQSITDSYPHYEIPNQNADNGFNGARTNTDNSHKNSQLNEEEEVVRYIDNFPVILLKENEIRR